MVCDRCIMVLRNEFQSLGLKPVNIGLGEIEIEETALSAEKISAIDIMLHKIGFERTDDRVSRLAEKVKILINTTINTMEGNRKRNWSDIISSELNYDFNYISSLFSSVEGITLEQYIILRKIDKAKELIVYDELSFSEIAWKLDYSSVTHLSSQFKRITGISPGQFRKQKVRKRQKSHNH